MAIELVDAMAAESANVPALAEGISTLTGFDREDAENGGKSLGILEFCLNAASGEVHIIGSDKKGLYTLETGRTTFADGSALADRTLCQYHDSGEADFSYWFEGELVTVTDAKKIQVATDFEGYIYYNDAGELDTTITAAHTLIVSTALVAYLYLNGTENELVWYADERHGMVMDGQTHLAMHKDEGFFVANGLEMAQITNNDTDFDPISIGNCGDEDVKAWFETVTSTAKFLYMEGASSHWRIQTDNTKFGLVDSGNVVYNNISGTPTLTTIGSDRVIMTFVATNNKLAPIVKHVGQTLYTTRNRARDGVQSDWWRQVLDGLPGPELQPIAAVIINNSSTGTVEEGADGETWYDMKHGGSIKRF